MGESVAELEALLLRQAHEFAADHKFRYQSDAWLNEMARTARAIRDAKDKER